jgi:hypothetical protein
MTKDVLQPGSSNAAPIVVDVTDRAGRLLGHITVDGQPIQVTINGQPILATIQEPLTVDAADGTVFVRSAAASTFPVNVGRIGGAPTDVNAGNAAAGTQRVVLASDQPAVDVVVAQDVDADPLTVTAAGLVPTLVDLIEEVRNLRDTILLVAS